MVGKVYILSDGLLNVINAQNQRLGVLLLLHSESYPLHLCIIPYRSIIVVWCDGPLLLGNNTTQRFLW